MEIATINVNGIKLHHEKLIDFINEENIDITCIQELHTGSTDSIFTKIEKATKDFFYINSKLKTSGVAILIRNTILNFQIEILTTTEKSFQNRLIHIQIKAAETINIINIYAPACNVHEQLQFYKDLKMYLQKFTKNITFLLGDFNYATDDIDRTGNLHYYDTKVKEIFNPNDLNLKDTFRTFYEHKVDFTYTVSRIDKIFIPNFLMTKVASITHMQAISDHKIVKLKIDLNKSYWKLNNYYLQDTYYRQEINELIKNCNKIVLTRSKIGKI